MSESSQGRSGRYMDHAATAPPQACALEAQAHAAATWFANPSSPHMPGQAAREALGRLRKNMARHCGAAGGRMVLMSGATEANNWVIRGVLDSKADARVLVTPDAHASMWNACSRFKSRMDVLPLDPMGRIRIADLAAQLTNDTALFCCPHVASETGVVHDMGALSALCDRRGVRFLADGAQALGHVPVDLSSAACDFYVFSAHKFGGPRGCGGVFVGSAGVPPLLDGGEQEWGLRPGTENLPALAGAVAALEEALSVLQDESGRLRALTRTILDAVRVSHLPAEVNGDTEQGRPGLLSLSFPGIDGRALVADLAIQGFAIGSGSACSSDRPEPSRAILALGRSQKAALGTLRISFGRVNRREDAEALAQALVETVQRLQTGGSGA